MVRRRDPRVRSVSRCRLEVRIAGSATYLTSENGAAIGGHPSAQGRAGARDVLSAAFAAERRHTRDSR